MIVRIQTSRMKVNKVQTEQNMHVMGIKIRKGASKCETVGEMQSYYKRQQGSDSIQIHRADIQNE